MGPARGTNSSPKYLRSLWDVLEWQGNLSWPQYYDGRPGEPKFYALFGCASGWQVSCLPPEQPGTPSMFSRNCSGKSLRMAWLTCGDGWA